MVRLAGIKFGLAILMFSFNFSYAFNKNGERNINIAGLVVNTQTLLPIESAKIYDSANNLLGTTDEKGYFNISIKTYDTKANELFFKLKVEKQGFRLFSDREHWANFDRNSIMYFGLSASKHEAKSFSKLVYNFNDDRKLSYDNVLAHFKEVRLEKEFKDKLETVKSGNENVLVQIDKQLYIVNRNGWIRINSGNDLISVNSKQVLTADKLNATFKRKNIKSMTPLDSKEEAKFAIYTR